MDYAKFEKTIGLNFKDKELLKQAFVHRSYINENKQSGLAHNERLEFLGDAVLELVITDYLYKKYTDKAEGELTAYRSSLVNADTCSEIATDLKMGDTFCYPRARVKMLVVLDSIYLPMLWRL